MRSNPKDSQRKKIPFNRFPSPGTQESLSCTTKGGHSVTTRQRSRIRFLPSSAPSLFFSVHSRKDMTSRLLCDEARSARQNYDKRRCREMCGGTQDKSTFYPSMPYRPNCILRCHPFESVLQLDVGARQPSTIQLHVCGVEPRRVSHASPKRIVVVPFVDGLKASGVSRDDAVFCLASAVAEGALGQ